MSTASQPSPAARSVEPPWHIQTARALLLKRRTDEAVRILRRAMDRNLGCAETQLLLAKSLVAGGRLLEARVELEQLFARESEKSTGALLSRVCMALGDPLSALRVASALLASSPRDSKLRQIFERARQRVELLNPEEPTDPEMARDTVRSGPPEPDAGRVEILDRDLFQDEPGSYPDSEDLLMQAPLDRCPDDPEEMPTRRVVNKNTKVKEEQPGEAMVVARQQEPEEAATVRLLTRVKSRPLASTRGAGDVLRGRAASTLDSALRRLLRHELLDRRKSPSAGQSPAPAAQQAAPFLRLLDDGPSARVETPPPRPTTAGAPPAAGEGPGPAEPRPPRPQEAVRPMVPAPGTVPEAARPAGSPTGPMPRPVEPEADPISIEPTLPRKKDDSRVARPIVLGLPPEASARPARGERSLEQALVSVLGETVPLKIDSPSPATSHPIPTVLVAPPRWEPRSTRRALVPLLALVGAGALVAGAVVGYRAWRQGRISRELEQASDMTGQHDAPALRAALQRLSHAAKSGGRTFEVVALAATLHAELVRDFGESSIANIRTLLEESTRKGAHLDPRAAASLAVARAQVALIEMPLPQALVQIMTMLREHPDNTSLQRLQAEALMLSGDLDGARKILDRLPDGDLRVLRLRVRLLWQLGERDEARALLESLVSRGLPTRLARLELARYAVEEGTAGRSTLQDLRKLLAGRQLSAGERAWTQILLAEVYYGQGYMTQAMTALNRALSIDLPHVDPELRFRATQLLLSTRRYSEALSQISEACRRSPLDGRYLRLLVRATRAVVRHDLAMGNSGRALTILAGAVKGGPGAQEARKELGRLAAEVSRLCRSLQVAPAGCLR